MDIFIKAIYQKNILQLESMVTDGFDVNTIDEDGRSGLMHAVLDSDSDSDVSIIQFLINSGVDINHQDGVQKWSALHFAARDNKKDIVSILL